MGTLSFFDRQTIETLRNAGVFEDINAHRINMRNGVIIIRCPDCDQKDDAEGHDRQLALVNGGRDRLHLLLHHGGAAVAALGSQLYPGFDIPGYLAVQIREAENLKRINTILLEVHAPCGKGEDAGLNIVQLIMYMMMGKPMIKAVDPSNEVVCRVHVDYADGRKRTYFISRNKWIAFWQTRGRALWDNLFAADPYPDSDVVMVATVREPTVAPSVHENHDDQSVIPMEEASNGALALLAANQNTLLVMEHLLDKG